MVNAGEARIAGEKQAIYLLFLKNIKKIHENLAALAAPPAKTKWKFNSSFVDNHTLLILNNFCAVPVTGHFGDEGEGESQQYWTNQWLIQKYLYYFDIHFLIKRRVFIRLIQIFLSYNEKFWRFVWSKDQKHYLKDNFKHHRQYICHGCLAVDPVQVPLLCGPFVSERMEVKKYQVLFCEELPTRSRKQ